MTSFLIRWTQIFYCDSELSPFTKGFIRQVENLNHRRYDVGLMHCYSTASHQRWKRTRNKKNAYEHIQALTNQTKHKYTIPKETHTHILILCKDACLLISANTIHQRPIQPIKAYMRQHIPPLSRIYPHRRQNAAEQQCIYKYIYESISFLCNVLKRPHLG